MEGPQPGDVYESGYLAVPVRLKAGDTPIYLRSARGRVRVLVTDSPKPFELDTRDTTLPDTVVGQKGVTWGSLVVRNATDQTAFDLTIETHADGGRTRRVGVLPIPPFGVEKRRCSSTRPAEGLSMCVWCGAAG